MLKTRADIARLARAEITSRRYEHTVRDLSVVDFARKALHFEPWEAQRDILEAVVPGARVAVRSGHKIGKSRLAGAAALYWAATKPNSTVLLTSSSYPQVEHILWHEITLLSRLVSPLIESICQRAFSGLVMRNGSRIFGFTTNKTERAGGYSSSTILMIADEASGIDDDIFEALEGNRAGGGALLLLGNPTVSWGKFYDAFNKYTSSRFWKLFHVPSTAVPAGIPGLATQTWCQEMLEEWGPTDPRYKIRVLGEFPDESQTRVISDHVIESAFRRHPSRPPSSGQLTVGVDVARFGEDRTVIFPRLDLYAFDPTILRGADSLAVSAAVARIVRSIRHDSCVVVVDAGNSISLAVIDQLVAAGGLRVVGIKGSDKSAVVGRAGEYANIRAQLWFECGEWLETGTCSRSKELSEELAAKFFVDSKGRVIVEDKKSMHSRLNRSPDIADALCLATHKPKAGSASYESSSSRGRWAPRKRL